MEDAFFSHKIIIIILIYGALYSIVANSTAIIPNDNAIFGVIVWVVLKGMKWNSTIVLKENRARSPKTLVCSVISDWKRYFYCQNATSVWNNYFVTTIPVKSFFITRVQDPVDVIVMNWHAKSMQLMSIQIQAGLHYHLPVFNDIKRVKLSGLRFSHNLSHHKRSCGPKCWNHQRRFIANPNKWIAEGCFSIYGTGRAFVYFVILLLIEMVVACVATLTFLIVIGENSATNV